MATLYPSPPDPGDSPIMVGISILSVAIVYHDTGLPGRQVPFAAGERRDDPEPDSACTGFDQRCRSSFLELVHALLDVPVQQHAWGYSFTDGLPVRETSSSSGWPKHAPADGLRARRHVRPGDPIGILQACQASTALGGPRSISHLRERSGLRMRRSAGPDLKQTFAVSSTGLPLVRAAIARQARPPGLLMH